MYRIIQRQNPGTTNNPRLQQRYYAYRLEKPEPEHHQYPGKYCLKRRQNSNAKESSVAFIEVRWAPLNLLRRRVLGSPSEDDSPDV